MIEKMTNSALVIVVIIIVLFLLFGCAKPDAPLDRSSLALTVHCEIYDFGKPSQSDTKETARLVHDNRIATENLCEVFGVRSKDD